MSIFQARAGRVHTPSFRARHNEGSKPGFEIAVVLRSAEALLTSFRLVIPWAKQIGVSQLSSEGWIFRCFFGDIDEACNGASRSAAAYGFDAHLNMRAIAPKPLERSLLKEMNPRSDCTESKPQQWTIRAPVLLAVFS